MFAFANLSWTAQITRLTFYNCRFCHGLSNGVPNVSVLPIVCNGWCPAMVQTYRSAYKKGIFIILFGNVLEKNLHLTPYLDTSGPQAWTKNG